MPLVALPLAITIAVAPAQLRMEPTPPTATVTVTAPDAKQLRLWCSAGEVSAPTVLGDGRFAAQYRPPASGKPTYAVLAAWDEASGEAAVATVALAARTEIPVETEAGAQVVAVVHGRRSTAHANAAGHARVPAWVWPGERTATVTALDAAGNATSSEVALELPPPDGVFLLAPPEVAAGAPARVYAFATGGAVPTLRAPGANLDLTSRPGVVSAVLRARADTTLTASVGAERVTAAVRVAAATPPPARSIALSSAPVAPATPAPPAPPPKPRPRPPIAAPPARASVAPSLSPWELGVAVTGRYGGDFLGVGAGVQARRRFGAHVALGVDLDGRYASGTLDDELARLGGGGARLVGELRLPVGRAAVFVAADAGAVLARVRRTPAAGASRNVDYAAPTVGGDLGVLAPLGPGLFEIAVGYAWTPLLAAGRVNIDGAALTVGYRAARWRRRRRARARRARARSAASRARRGDGTRCARLRRRAPRT